MGFFYKYLNYQQIRFLDFGLNSRAKEEKIRTQE